MNTLDPNYTFTITEVDDVQTIILTQVDSGKTKTFVSVGKSMVGLDNHMSSLSEETCDTFFGKKLPKGKKK